MCLHSGISESQKCEIINVSAICGDNIRELGHKTQDRNNGNVRYTLGQDNGNVIQYKIWAVLQKCEMTCQVTKCVPPVQHQAPRLHFCYICAMEIKVNTTDR